jgi:DNA repair protein RecN
MIKTLHISNYALIDRIDITFFPGLNIITGETGAGKSIILGALGLLLGGRADTKVVRDPNVKSVIEATFSADGYTSLQQFCEENDIDWDDDTVILRREISTTGRSRAFINDSPVNLAQLQTAGLFLIDIHSQHQNLLLASPPYQLQVIDSVACNATLNDEFHTLYNSYRQALRQYKQERIALDKARTNEEFLRYQYDMLVNASLQPGELEELENERKLLANMAQVKASLQLIGGALTDGDTNADDLVREAAAEASQIASYVDDGEVLADRLEALRVELRDIAATFADADGALSDDPARLDEVEERLNLLYDLLRRQQAETIEQLIEIRDRLANEIKAIDLGDEGLQKSETAAKKAKRAAMEKAEELSASRKAAAQQFAADLKERATPLGMKNLQVEISIKPVQLSATGIDAIEFLFAFNKNQPLMPVGSTASGGEISRLMLSIKSLVAHKMQLPSIVFDEVDTGVSGDVAHRMGALMKDISENIQVIAITHLPQVAAKGNAHFRVFKTDTDSSTITRIELLSPENRIAEIAQMLSGSTIDQAALANARALIDNA